jgi:excisionase family DNA binding protein
VSRAGLEPATRGLKAAIGHFGEGGNRAQGFVSVGVEGEGVRPATTRKEALRGDFAGHLLAAAPRRLRSVDGGADRVLSVRQVAEKLGVCTRTVYQLVGRGELPHVRITNAIRVAPTDLAEFLAGRRRSGAARRA